MLRNILRLASEELPSSPPQVKPRAPHGQPAAQAEPLLLMSPATPRRPQTLPPLEARGRSETPRLGHSQSRGRTLSRASSQGGRSRASSRASNASHVSNTSRASRTSNASRASRVSRVSRASSRTRSIDARRMPKRSGSVQSLQSRISNWANQYQRAAVNSPMTSEMLLYQDISIPVSFRRSMLAPPLRPEPHPEATSSVARKPQAERIQQTLCKFG